MLITQNEVCAINNSRQTNSKKILLDKEYNCENIPKLPKKTKNNHKLKTAICIVGGVLLTAVIVTLTAVIISKIYNTVKSHRNILSENISARDVFNDPDPTAIIRKIYPNFRKPTREELEFFNNLPPDEQTKVRMYYLQQVSSDRNPDSCRKNPKLEEAINKSCKLAAMPDNCTIYYAYDSLGKSHPHDGDIVFKHEDLHDNSLPQTEAIKNSLMKSKIVIMNEMTVESIPKLYNLHIIARDSNVGVLDYGNYCSGSGHVGTGCGAQEEDISVKSNLYGRLMDIGITVKYYLGNQRELNSDSNSTSGTRILYCENVQFFSNNAIYPVGLIVAAAPKIGRIDGNGFVINANDSCYAQRIEDLSRGIFATSRVNHNNVLVLGALGCGAFNNPPELVAQTMKKLLIDQGLARQYDKVILAIPDSSGENYRTFRRVFANAREINVN